MDKKENILKVNVYQVLSRAIEEGLELGWNHAYKHTDDPGKDSILEHQLNDILNTICEVFKFDDE